MACIQMLVYSTCPILSGMDMAVPPKVDVVHNWECHGSIGEPHTTE